MAILKIPIQTKSIVWVINALIVTYSAAGCTLFECNGTYPVDEARYADNSEVTLEEKVRSRALAGVTSCLSLQYTPSSTAFAVSTEAYDPKQKYELKIDEQAKRACVVESATQRVILSADFSDRKAWTDPDDQPEWATQRRKPAGK